MQGTAGQQQAHMDSQLPARSRDLPWSTSLAVQCGGFSCSSGGIAGTQDFPFLLRCIPARKPSRASSQQELISRGTFRRAQVSLSHLSLLHPGQSSWQGGGEVNHQERAGAGNAAAGLTQRGSSWTLDRWSWPGVNV